MFLFFWLLFNVITLSRVIVVLRFIVFDNVNNVDDVCAQNILTQECSFLISHLVDTFLLSLMSFSRAPTRHAGRSISFVYKGVL